MITKDRDQIGREVVSALEDYLHKPSDFDEDTLYCLFLNNFTSNLPCRPTRRNVTQQWLDNPRYNVNGKTLRQFYQDIDRAIEICNINVELMTELAARGKEDIKQRRKLSELVLPVFVELLSMGYSSYDLTG